LGARIRLNEFLLESIGAGGSYNWNDDKYSLYSEVSINTSLSNFADSYRLNGTAGFRMKF
jgi:fibronectin-binding autotransporter adhesin